MKITIYNAHDKVNYGIFVIASQAGILANMFKKSKNIYVTSLFSTFISALSLYSFDNNQIAFLNDNVVKSKVYYEKYIKS